LESYRLAIEKEKSEKSANELTRFGLVDRSAMWEKIPSGGRGCDFHCGRDFPRPRPMEIVNRLTRLCKLDGRWRFVFQRRCNWFARFVSTVNQSDVSLSNMNYWKITGFLRTHAEYFIANWRWLVSSLS